MKSENAEIHDAIDRTFVGTFGGRATSPEVVDELIQTLPGQVQDYVLRHGLALLVGRYFREKCAECVAPAPAADVSGTHVQLALLDADEYRYVVSRHVKAGKERFDKARRYADLAQERLGVTISLADPFEDRAAS